MRGKTPLHSSRGRIMSGGARTRVAEGGGSGKYVIRPNERIGKENMAIRGNGLPKKDYSGKGDSTSGGGRVVRGGGTL